MAVKAKTKKPVHKRAAKREVEIPVHVVSRKIEPPVEKMAEEKKEENITSRIVEDENKLPVFEHAALSDEKVSEEEAAAMLKEEKRKVLNEEEGREKEVEPAKAADKINGWSPRKKITVLWTSVAAIGVLVLAVWFAVVGKSISFDFGSKTYNYFKETVDASGAADSLNDVKEQWVNLEDYLKEQAAAGADAATLEKLKEKILVEEMKNKLENK